ncbi:hypothetical protein [Phytoactinopolyspora mesophila]|uniref:Alpha/beta hydrolase n=1 Tax=Phytoactinopolyspora mesophila TaxID=2650750 RepID=A0A7K3MBD3_9ACTN|nr:hypothetical protein [Phytoactinopolyspora mesophila]NDL60460.1 hypothetical protein [Phytoactinopolyspora mesophila]
MKPGALVLVTGPVDPVDWWAATQRELAGTGLAILAPRDGAAPPLFGVSWIASVAQALNTSALDDPLALVAHGTAGPLLPALARAQRAAGRHVGGYIFVDATLPRPGTTSHLDLLRAAAPAEADVVHERLHESGGLWPADPAGGVRQHDHQFWTETLPPAIDWPDAPCIYVRTGQEAPGCGDTAFWARSAGSRGWPVIEETDVTAGLARALDQLPG